MERTWSSITLPRGNIRAGHDQRDVESGVVKEDTVRRFAVFAQALAVIAHHDNQSARGEAQLIEAIEQAPHLLVHVSNFAVVEVLRVQVLVRLGRVVRLVGIVVVRPEEELPLAILLQPVERAIGHHAGAPLRKIAGKSSLLRLMAHVIVISIKPMGEAKVLRHHPRAHKGRRLRTPPPG